MRQEVTTNDKDIVAGLKQALVARIGNDRFDLWFGAAVSLRLCDGTLEIVAPDQFTLERIRQKFQSELRQACEAVLGVAPALEFRVQAPTVAPPLTATCAESTAGSTTSVPTPRLSESSNGAARKLETFSSFVVGDSNRLAYTAALSVAQRPGTMTPLYIYGATGVGKTHLLQSILETARHHGQRRRSILLSAEQFTSYFVYAIREQGLPSFRRKYRDVELLLIDDLQFFANKRATIVELQHTMDTLLREGRQLVFTADRSPAELSGFGRELTARIAGGLVCRLEPADQATRLQILQQQALRRNLVVPEEALALMAERLDGDARQLSGALNRLQATSEALGEPVSLALTQSALEDVFHAAQRFVRLPDIEKAVCDVFGLEPQSLHSTRKAKAVSQPRMLAMWLARKHTRAAFSEIGHYFGRRSHSTVISARNKIKRWLTQGTAIQLREGTCSVEEAVRRIERRLQAG